MSPDQEEIVFRLCIILCQFIPAKIDRLFAHCRGLSELFDKIHYGKSKSFLNKYITANQNMFLDKSITAKQNLFLNKSITANHSIALKIN